MRERGRQTVRTPAEQAGRAPFLPTWACGHALVPRFSQAEEAGVDGLVERAQPPLGTPKRAPGAQEDPKGCENRGASIQWLSVRASHSAVRVMISGKWFERIS
ncbi:hypothetical protein SGRIM119S_02565 [Streptomyces griseorubiginosus]